MARVQRVGEPPLPGDGPPQRRRRVGLREPDDAVVARPREVLRRLLERARGVEPVPNSTTGLGGPDKTSEFSSSVKSKSIRLIFGRIDCSYRVLGAQPKSLCKKLTLKSG